MCFQEPVQFSREYISSGCYKMVGRVTATNHLEKNKSGKRYRNTVALCFTGEIFRCTVVHKSCHQLSQYQYSTTSVIQTSIIRHLNYPTSQLSECKISQATPTFTKATCVVAIAKYGIFKSSKQHGAPKMY